jgi:hypothetical protein
MSHQAERLCWQLIKAESEAEVINILQAAGHWDDPDQWRYYGDNELNFAQGGGQQSRADFAFNEKAVNSVDSVLTRMSIDAGIAPDGPSAPQTIREAVARFIEGNETGVLKVTSGRVEDWTRDFRRSVAQNISVFATEPKGWTSRERPTISIADLGEGHTPSAFPRTFVSLGQRNKVSIPFVQGKFNQGGSGALRFCGDEKLQLIVSRRKQSLLASAAAPDDYPVDDETDSHWGFTVVRREGGARLPTYSYLAPLGSSQHPRRGGVLHFAAASMALFPEGSTPYAREVEWGTLIKLYEYKLPNSGPILRRSGLLMRMDLLLPDPALPIRMHECRERQNKGASEQTTTMAGLFTRLQSSGNLEELSPSSVPINVNGRDLAMKIFAFQEGKAATYRADEGVVFTVNGQAHAFIKANIFARKTVGLQRLASDLLVYVDCSSLSPLELADAFMSSRDRLVDDNPFAKEIEGRIVAALHDHEGLRELKARRAAADLQGQLADNKPLEDVLRRVLRTSPALARLFGQGLRLHNPMKSVTALPTKKKFKGKPHPTYFRFHGKDEGVTLRREAFMERRVRLRFETDVENEYFTRRVDKGERRLTRIFGDRTEPVANFTGPTLNDGGATLTFDLPEDANDGDLLSYELVVHDPVTDASFVNRAELTVRPKAAQTSGPPSGRRQPDKPQDSGVDGPAGLSLPKIVWLSKDDHRWATHFSGPDDCLDVIDDAEEEEGVDKPEHDYKFYLNEDNRALHFELASNKLAAEAIKKQFEIAVTLIGLSILHDADRAPQSEDQKSANGSQDSENLDTGRNRVMRATRAIAPVLLPMINTLSDLGQFEVDESDLVGQAA